MIWVSLAFAGITLEKGPSAGHPDAKAATHRCMALVAYDKAGVPEDVRLAECPSPFGPAVVRAAEHLRFGGVRRSGEIWVTYRFADGQAAKPALEHLATAESVETTATEYLVNLETVHRVAPTYPDGAEGEALCTCRIDLGADGVPTEVTVSDCDGVFHDAARDAVVQWRWKPRQKPVQTAIRVRFKPAD